MQNLTPHRRFKGPALVRASFGPHYQHPWPAELPESCEVCNTKFRTNFNIIHGPGKTGRLLRNIAHYGLLPGILFGFVLPATIPGLVEVMISYQHSGLLFGSLLLGPLLVKFLSLFMPLSRHLVCKKCGWNRDYKALPAPQLEPVSEETEPPVSF